MSNDNKLSRRDFIKDAAIAGAAVATAGVLGTNSAQAQTQCPPSTVPAKWDMEADVVVAGSGCTGLPAAVAAIDAGSSVILVEANQYVGGNAIISGGGLGIGGGNRLQKEAKVEENAQTLYEDLTLHTLRPDVNNTMTIRCTPGEKNDAASARAFADRSLDTWNWLETHGCQFSSVTVQTPINRFWGSRATTSCTPGPVDPEGKSKAGGVGLIRPLENYARSKGVKILLKHKLTRIIREGERTGRVLGIEVENEGKKLYVKAKKGVVLGTGSWKGHKVLRKFFNPLLSDDLIASGEPFVYSDGSGIMAALDVGAALQSDQGQDLHSWHRHFGTLYHNFPLNSPYAKPGLSIASMGDVIFVNKAGKRFIDETTPETTGWIVGNPPFSFYDVALDQEGHILWLVFDDAAAKREKWTVAPPQCEKDLVFSAPTLRELAGLLKVPADALTETVTKYNSSVDAGKDAEFGKAKDMLKYKIETPPFYGAWISLQIHDTTGGLSINAKSQVLDFHGSVIPSLYAGGEATAGIFTIGLARGVIFGRIAGENAAAEKPWGAA